MIATLALAATLCASTLPAPAAGELAEPSNSPATQRTRVLMGTLCAVRAEGADTVAAAAAIGAALDEIARLERVMSSWRDDSELARLNAAGVDGWACSPDLFAVLDSANTWSRATDGAFDATVEPLDQAWDLRGAGRVPDPATLARARDHVDWRGLALDRATRRARLARAGMGVDLGGIGKGFALDRAAEVLRARGVERGRLNLGGEVLVLGRGEVPVARPDDRLAAAATLAVADAAISTSAQSERGFTSHGRRYGHVLDPRTGMPVQSRAAVTVVAATATRADALSTAFLVWGRERTEAFARDHPEVGVLWLEPDGRRVKAWRWNVVADGADASVTWMNAGPGTARAAFEPKENP